MPIRRGRTVRTLLSSLAATAAISLVGAPVAPAAKLKAPPMLWTLQATGVPVVEAGGVTYLPGTIDGVGTTLLRTDGTSAGTQLVTGKDGKPTPAPQNLTAFDGRVYFTVKTGPQNPLTYAIPQALWQSDGTPAGTRRVVASLPVGEGAWLQVAGASLYLGIGGAVHRLEGSALREVYRAPRSAVWPVAATPNGNLYLSVVRDPEARTEASLVRMDPAGSTLTVAERYGGYGVTVGDEMYFTASDEAHGQEPWVTDGSANGTKLVADLAPGPASADGIRLFADGRVVLAETYLSLFTGSRSVFTLSRSGATPLTNAAGEPFDALEGFYPAGPATTYLKLGRNGATFPTTPAGPSLLGPGVGLPIEQGMALGTSTGALVYAEYDSPRVMRYAGDGQPAQALATVEREPVGRANGYYPAASAFAEAGGLVYFSSVSDGVRRMWRTDGTPQGTSPLIPPTLTVQVSLAHVWGDTDHQLSGMVQFPQDGAARCKGTATITIRRNGKLRLRLRPQLTWSGTSCRFVSRVAHSTFKQSGRKRYRFTARATIGTGKQQLSSLAVDIA